MAFIKKVWEDRQSEYPNRRKLMVTGIADTYTVERDEGLVMKEGNPFNAISMNDLESRMSAGIEGVIPTLTHALSSTIHTLTGIIPTAGYATVRFKATADYKAGDTFKIGAVVYTAKPTGEEVSLPDKAFTTGDIVSCEVDIASKRINFKLGSAGLPDGWNEKATGEAIEPIAKSAPIVQQIYGSWDTQINSLPPPDVLPSNFLNCVDYSNDNQYLAVGGGSSPYLSIYKCNGDTMTKLANPTSLPTGTVGQVKFSPDGAHLAVLNGTGGANLTIYKRTGDTFTKLAAEYDFPSTRCFYISFSPDCKYMAVSHYAGSDNKNTSVYRRNGDRYSLVYWFGGNASGTNFNGKSVEFSPDSKYLIFITTDSSGAHLCKISENDTFTQISTVGAYQDSKTIFSPDGNYIAQIRDVAPFLKIYRFANETATKLEAPDIVPIDRVNDIAFSADGIYLMAVGDFGINIYKRLGDVFTKIANPSPQPNGRVLGVDCSNSGTYMSVAHVGSPYITTYRTQTKPIIRNATHWSNSPLSWLPDGKFGMSLETKAVGEQCRVNLFPTLNKIT